MPLIIAIALSVALFWLGYGRLYFFRKSGSQFFPANQNWWSDYSMLPIAGIELCFRHPYVLVGFVALLLGLIAWSLFFWLKSRA